MTSLSRDIGYIPVQIAKCDPFKAPKGKIKLVGGAE
jgi:hypothetical protein